MVSYRVVPFHPRGFDRGEGRRGRDVEDVSAFREWIEDKGDSFTQTAPGVPGGVLIYAWSGSKPWILVGETRVIRSGPSGRVGQPHQLVTEKPSLYPNNVPWPHGGLFVDVGRAEYEAIRKRAFEKVGRP